MQVAGDVSGETGDVVEVEDASPTVGRGEDLAEGGGAETGDQDRVDRVIQDRIDWSGKVVVVEEEHEAQTFIENKETLNDQNFDKKLLRPRMGMVADMVEAEQR